MARRDDLPYAFTVALRRDGNRLQPVVRVLRNGEERWTFADRASPRQPALSDAAGWLHFLADEIERTVFDETTFSGLPCDPIGEEVAP